MILLPPSVAARNNKPVWLFERHGPFSAGSVYGVIRHLSCYFSAKVSSRCIPNRTANVNNVSKLKVSIFVLTSWEACRWVMPIWRETSASVQPFSLILAATRAATSKRINITAASSVSKPKSTNILPLLFITSISFILALSSLTVAKKVGWVQFVPMPSI